MRRWTVTVLAVALGLTVAVVAACGGGDEPSAGPFGIDRPGDPGMPGVDGELVEGDGYEGVLLDAGLDWLQRSDGTVAEDVTPFVPSAGDVARFETALTTEEPTDLTDYVRQYTGVASADGTGDRHLVVAGICASAAGPGGSLDDWRDGWIEVADGGDCFWDATMDLASGDILRFGFHGSA
jgi:hypothetical protein